MIVAIKADSVATRDLPSALDILRHLIGHSAYSEPETPTALGR